MRKVLIDSDECVERGCCKHQEAPVFGASPTHLDHGSYLVAMK